MWSVFYVTIYIPNADKTTEEKGNRRLNNLQNIFLIEVNVDGPLLDNDGSGGRGA